MPFPVVSAIFDRYGALWNAFSGHAVRLPIAVLRHVRVMDFKVSCVASPFGVGAQGWITLEMDKGRTEEEIALLNGLVDFAFYCGTGLHTEEGLGQTKRMEKRART